MTNTNAQAKVAVAVTKSAKAVKPAEAAAVKATPVNKDVILQSSGSAGGKQSIKTYTVVDKYRGACADSTRAKQLAIVFKYTSIAAAKAAGAQGCDITFAAMKGFIKFT